jgi:hypothetical protein
LIASKQASTNKQTMSSKASKKAALAKFRDAKRKRIMGEDEPDDLFGGTMKEEEDVYDVVDEDQYQTLVNSRRQREDFVVDDGKPSKNGILCY